MRWLAIALFLACNCGPLWDLNQPIAVEILSPSLPAAAIADAFRDAVTQLGGTPAAVAPQTVRVAYDAACNCRSCTSATIAHTEQDRGTIWLCPYFLASGAAAIIPDTIFHELGRVFGYFDSLPCPAMMSAYYNCRQDHARYWPEDKAAICSSGGVRGGGCD